jgi:hypothetical protein
MRHLRLDDERRRVLGEKARKEQCPAMRNRTAVIRALIDYYAASPADIETVLRDLNREDLHEPEE